jgi:mRNA-degrading endonuclease RelE of RelBE toxin-antitoxin system
MQHFISSKFEKAAKKLPKRIAKKLDASFEILKENSNHPALQFKKVGNLYSIRITLNYRALAYKDEQDYIWFWVGEHDEYDKLINNL